MELRIKSPSVWGIKSNAVGIINQCMGYSSDEHNELCYSSGVNYIVGRYSEGKWALPYILSHKRRTIILHDPIDDNKSETIVINHIKKQMMYTIEYIMYNGRKADINEILDLSCYIGERKYSRRKRLSYYIQKGCKKSKINYNEFVEISEQGADYYERTLDSLWHEEELYYRSLIAISEGKKIICFPWLFDSKILKINRLERLNVLAEKYNCVILIPIQNEE
ncbi:MAG: hypothetical protein Q4A05_06620 [Ruminococcus sp.]|nr:hypothetical protein [Ruminococcus sp.]